MAPKMHLEYPPLQAPTGSGMGGAEEMEEVNGTGAAPENGASNGSAPEEAATSDPPDAGQSEGRKRSRRAAGEEGAAEGAAEVVAPEAAQEPPKKRKSKVLSLRRSAEALLLAGVGF